ncbi:DUF5642 family protein [Mycobacterium sp. Y57]|nr:DUF5642 family protein [Mycolicibacterium xanthum]
MVCGACASQTTAPEETSSAPVNLTIDPTRIDRARVLLPEGYEVTAYPGPPTPLAVWGFGGEAAAQPPQCLELAAPAVDPASARGWSASGPGGIVYAVVAAASRPEAADATLIDECAAWSVAAGHTTGAVTAVPSPAVDAASTTGMRTSAETVVEGGTETRSHADTFVAYLGAYICFVVLVTDPGSPVPTLGADFAAGLLEETVRTLRG